MSVDRADARIGAGVPAAPDDALAALRRTLPASAAAHHGADRAFSPWAYQGALLAEFARSRGFESQEWLGRCGVVPGQALSPRQLLSMLAALQPLARDVGFVVGQLSLPGHYGLASQALQQAGDLRQALRVLCDWPARLSPLLTPRLVETPDELLLVCSGMGLPDHRCPAARRPACSRCSWTCR